MTSVPGFLTKTFEIFSSIEYADCCGWGANGETILIRKIEQFSKQVLPKYFKHSNFQSFVRQLNMYDFHKTVQDPNHGEFKHEFFRQGRPELLCNIKRKANKPPEQVGVVKVKGKSSSGSKAGGVSAGAGGASSAGAGGAGSSINSAGSGINSAGAASAGACVTGSTVTGSSRACTSASAVDGASLTKRPASSIGMPPPSAGTIGAGSSDAERSGARPANPHVPHTYVGDGVGGGGYTYPPPLAQPSGAPEEPQESDQLEMSARDTRDSRGFEQRMEHKLAQLECENALLKRMFAETHSKNAAMQERMDRVLKTIYNIFVASSGGVMIAAAGGNGLVPLKANMLLTDADAQSEGGGVLTQSSEVSQLLNSMREAVTGGGGGSESGSGGGSGGGGGSGSGGYSEFELGPHLPYSHDGGDLLRLDSLGSINLERLPSLEFDELPGASAADLLMSPHFHAGHAPQAYQNHPNQAGMLLSHSARGNSFEFAASSVSAPLHHPQTSFDGGLFSGGGRTEGRRDTGLISPRHGVLGVLGGVGGVGASTSSTSGRVELLDSPAPIPPGGALRRQFSHEPSGRLGGTERLGLEKERKRKSDELSQVSSSPSGLNTVKVEAVPDSKKKLKMLDGGGVLGGAPKELSLASEGGEGGHSMHSTHAHSSRLHASIPSMHEAHHFIDLLSMKQQTTLTRLDSLEMTIASLLDVDGEEATTAEVADAMASLASLARGIGEALPAPEPE